MILEFKTARNVNGHRKYLLINTDEKIYSIECSTMIIYGVEIKTSDYKSLLEKVENAGYIRQGL